MFKINNQHEDILQSVGMNDHPVPLEIRKKLVNLHLQSALVTWQIQNHLPQTIDSRELTGEYIKLFQDNEVFFQVLTGKSLEIGSYGQKHTFLPVSTFLRHFKVG
ncbi:MAG: hypothetical protein ACFFD4_04045 [Candidatus Odinarchaeota archaeon]